MMLMISKAVTSPVSQYGAPDLGVGFGGGLEDEGWGIPPLLYKTGRYSNEAAFPHQLTVTFREIRSQNLNHRLVYVNDSQIRNVLSGHTAELGNDVVRLFESLRPGAYRADIGRFALLWAFGGIYSDLPQTFARPLDAIIPTSSNVSKTTDLPAHFFASDRPRPSELPDDRTLLFGIQTSFFAAPPGSPLLLVVLRGILDQIRAKDLGRNPLDVTGPAAVYRHVAGYLNLTGSDPETWGEIERTKIKVGLALQFKDTPFSLQKIICSSFVSFSTCQINTVSLPISTSTSALGAHRFEARERRNWVSACIHKQWEDGRLVTRGK